MSGAQGCPGGMGQVPRAIGRWGGGYFLVSSFLGSGKRPAQVLGGSPRIQKLGHSKGQRRPVGMGALLCSCETLECRY